MATYPLQITNGEVTTILQAAIDGDIQTLDRYVHLVAQKNNIPPGAVLHRVKGRSNGATALHNTVGSRAPIEYFADRDGNLFGGLEAPEDLICGLFNQRDSKGRNTALIACRHDDPAYLDSLVEMGSSVYAVDNDEYEALHTAAIYNCPSIIKVLVEKYGVRPERTSPGGITAAHLSAAQDSLEAFMALFVMTGRYFMQPNARGHSPIDEAYRSDATRIMSFLQNGLGMGMGRPVSVETERQAIDNMIQIWKKDERDVGELVGAWVDGVQDGVQGAWEEAGQDGDGGWV